MVREDLWEKAIAFHGHSCGGLAIGFKAALLAMELLDVSEASEDEEIVCISENDACGVDAIQSLLGYSTGKGNLILRLRGKQTFTFFNRRNGKSARAALKEFPPMPREEKMRFLLESDAKALFFVSEAKTRLPEKAHIFNSRNCVVCGERTAEPWLRVANGSLLCLNYLEKLEEQA